MLTVNIHQAKTHLSKLLEAVKTGEPFIIAKAGKPIAKVIGVDSPEPEAVRRLGFLAGEFSVPEDFNEMGNEAILQDFGLNDETSP